MPGRGTVLRPHWRARLSIASAALLLALVASAQPIARSAAEVRAFRAENPCPSTGQRRGACPGYQVDHPDPLCAGGLDQRSNMQWISNEDHRFKTLVDARECRKLKKLASTPAK
jgi:hypothetical protein